jgi:hypothetical protein
MYTAIKHRFTLTTHHPSKQLIAITIGHRMLYTGVIINVLFLVADIAAVQANLGTSPLETNIRIFPRPPAAEP